MHNVRRFFFLISAVVTGCLLAVAGVFAYQYGFEAFLTIRPYVILSGSMEPGVPVGSMVLVKPEMRYEVGDIVTFRPEAGGSEMVTHRIAGINPDDTYFSQGTFTTKGDANKTADTRPVPSSQVFGRVFLTVPNLGYLVQFAKTPQGFVLLVIIPATIIIWEELKSAYGEIFGLVSRRRDRGTKSSGRVPLSWLAVGLVVFVAGLSVATKSVRSFLSDTEKSGMNVLGAAAVIVTPTPTPTSVTPTPTPTPGVARTLVINEVLPDTSCGDPHKEAEWIEVYNGYETTIDLKNYSITDGTNTIDLVNAVTNLLPGQFALLSHDTSIWGTGPNKCFDPPEGTITTNLGGGTFYINTGTLQLLDPSDQVIDTVIWGTASLNLVQNQSIEREPDGLDSALGTNFSAGDFTVRAIPMPGL